MLFQTIAVSQEGPIAEIRLNRPAQRNPIDSLFIQELETATGGLHDDASVRVVLITAEGEVFSSGREVGESRSAVAKITETLGWPFRCLELMGQPVIAVIEGDAIGAGLELALACDVRVAATDAMLALPDVTMGAMPSDGATQRLPRLVGRAKAAEMILLGEPVGGVYAAGCGLVNHIAPRAEVRATAVALASKIAERGPIAVRFAKEAMVRGFDMPLDQALRYETDLTIILQTTADRAEGVRAFLEKRPQQFQGQ